MVSHGVGARCQGPATPPEPVAVAQVLTDANVEDVETGWELIDAVHGPIAKVIGGAACDTVQTGLR